MTRKDFELIAQTLRQVKPPRMLKAALAQWRATVEEFAGQLATTNPGFRESRFLVACGYVPIEED